MANKTIRFTTRLSPGEKAALDEIARRTDMKVSEVMRLLIQRSAARYGVSTKAAA